MDGTRWERLQEVFAGAIELPTGDRAPFLEMACGADAELRGEVEGLLRSHRGGAQFLETRPERIGPYRLLREIGRGGMGSVFLAERDDGQFAQRVAIKFLNVAGAGLQRRFQDERQILANLTHPNIARLLDGGITAAGVPYIVMEYVDGTPIHRYCKGKPVEEKLRLFREVCSAVHDAHRNLTVHRDIKPANILVTAEGAPKLLDFGIAKMLSAAGEDTSVTGAMMMTPDYASPEQVRGAAISTSSDVYSLGVLLHELLTGRRPYSLTGRSFEEKVRIIAEQPVERARTGWDDLDAILAKAMRKEPGARYSSVEAFSADIGRFLEKRPVEARQGAVWYVASRFLARNRVGVATAALVVCLIVAAVGMVLRQAAIAERRFAEVRKLASRTIFQIHDTVAMLPGATAARKLILSSALESLDALARDSSGDRRLQLELAQGYLRLGGLQGLPSQANLGDTAGALASFAKARNLMISMAEKEPAWAEAQLVLGQTYRYTAVVLGYLRKPVEARESARRGVEVMEQLARKDPRELHRQLLAGAYTNMADVDGEAVAYRKKALELFEGLLRAAPGDVGRQRDAALANKYMAARMLDVRQGDAALPYLQRAEELDRARLAVQKNNREAMLDLSFDYSQNATYYYLRRMPEEALENYEKSLAIRRRLAALDPTDVRLQDRLIFVLRRTANARLNRKDAVGALALAREAEALSRKLLEKDASNLQYRTNLGFSMSSVGGALAAMGNVRGACAARREALRLLERDTMQFVERADLEMVRKSLAACAE